MDRPDSEPSNFAIQRQRGEHRRQRHLSLGMRYQLTRTLPYFAAPPPTQLNWRNPRHPPVYAFPTTIKGFPPTPSAPAPTRPNPRLSAAPQDDLRRLKSELTRPRKSHNAAARRQDVNAPTSVRPPSPLSATTTPRAQNPPAEHQNTRPKHIASHRPIGYNSPALNIRRTSNRRVP